MEDHGVLEPEGWGDRRWPEGPFAVSGTEVVELMRTRGTVAMVAAVGKEKIWGSVGQKLSARGFWTAHHPCGCSS